MLLINIVFLVFFISDVQMIKPPEDALLTIPQIIKKNGYPIEIHHVTTQDGFILELHRIPPSPTSQIRRPIFLHHGLTASSDAWILLGPGKALGYLLSDLGFDVWLGNGRGNTYSRNHTILDPVRDRRKFWDFSLHEMGIYDLPACIDHILNVSSQADLYYVGHSQGCGEAFVLFSELPEYNDKVKAFFALAPGVYIKNLKSVAIRLEALAVKIIGSIPLVKTIIGNFDFAPHLKRIYPIISSVCSIKILAQTVCSFPFYLVVGYSDQLDPDFVPVLYGHFPSGSSTKQLMHFNQFINSGIFRNYDYGTTKNMIIYKQRNPPKYKLENAKIPVYIYYSINDLLIVPKDVERLMSELPNLAMGYLVEHPDITHTDFTYGKDVHKYVYDSIIDSLKSLEGI